MPTSPSFTAQHATPLPAEPLFQKEKIWNTCIQLMKRILEMDNSNLEDFIISEKMTSFNQKPKDLKVVVVVPSVKKQNTFVLAGAGYRKAFIAEI